MNCFLEYVKIVYRLIAVAMQFNCNLFRYCAALSRYVCELAALKGHEKNGNFSFSLKHIYPCLRDWTAHTPLEPVYFYQDSWAVDKLLQNKPEHHYDVGSSAMMIGIISRFVPVTMIDIRPIGLDLDNLFFLKGSILELPFPGDSVASLSSLCVVEHIGLGRYGDPLDAWGSEKAIMELKRVLQPGGNLLLSVPVDSECRIYFNAHRAFTRKYLLELCAGLELVEEKFVYGTELCECFDERRGFGTGLFHLRKVLR